MKAISFPKAVAALRGDVDLISELNEEVLLPLGLELVVTSKRFELKTDEGDPVDFKDSEKYLLDTGILFAANTLVFHPRGLALALSCKDAVSLPTKFVVMQANEPIVFDDSLLGSAKEKLSRFLHDLPILPENYGKLSKLFQADGTL